MLPTVSSEKSAYARYREPQSEREKHFYRSAILYLHERLDEASLADARRVAVEEMRYHQGSDPVSFVNEYPALWFSILCAVSKSHDRLVAEERIWSVMRRDKAFEGARLSPGGGIGR